MRWKSERAKGEQNVRAGIILHNRRESARSHGSRTGASARQRVEPWPVAIPPRTNAGLGDGGAGTRNSPTVLFMDASEPRRVWEGPMPVGYARRNDMGRPACDEVLGRGRCSATLTL